MSTRLSCYTASSAQVETGVPSLAPSLPTSPPPVREFIFSAIVASAISIYLQLQSSKHLSVYVAISEMVY